MNSFDASLFQLHDILPTVVCTIIISILTYWLTFFKYKTNQYASHLMIGLYLRLFSCLINGLLSQYYYKGGDYIGYYERLLLSIYDYEHGVPLFEVVNFENSTQAVAQIGFLLSFIWGVSIQAISFTVVFFTLLGTWKLFLVLHDRYPTYRKEALIAVMYQPSVVFWSSGGLMKDSLVFGALGYCLYSAYHVFITKKNIIINSCSAIFFAWLGILIKPYIIIALIPTFVMFVYTNYYTRIKKRVYKILISFSFLVVFVTFIVLGNYLIMQSTTGTISRFSSDSILEEVQKQQQGYNNEGSYVNIGEFDMTISGFLKSFPAAINLTLFRPYIFEARNFVMILSSLESSWLLVLVARLLWTGGFKKVRFFLNKDPFLSFCLNFSFLFAGFIGISTFNFGTLVRYKIPCIPFFIFLILVLRKKLNKALLLDKNIN